MKFFVPWLTRRESTPDEKAGIIRVPGRTTVTVKSERALPEDFCQSHGLWQSFDGPCRYEYVLGFVSRLAELRQALEVLQPNWPGVLGLYVEQEVQTLYDVAPGPAFQYTYPDLIVQCGACRAFFPISELVYSELDFEDYLYNYRVCPRCGGWDCVELIYEC